MSSATEQDDSDDEFESADEGESISTSVIKFSIPSTTSVQPETIDEDWNIDDQLALDKSIERTKQLLSSSLSKTGGSLSQNGSDEDGRNQSSEQQLLQRKKLRKKTIESNLIQDENKTNARLSRRDDDESSSTAVTKRHVKDAHHVLDRLSAQSPTRTVDLIISLFQTHIMNLLSSLIGINHGVISDHFYPMLNRV